MLMLPQSHANHVTLLVIHVLVQQRAPAQVVPVANICTLPLVSVPVLQVTSAIPPTISVKLVQVLVRLVISSIPIAQLVILEHILTNNNV